MEEYNVFELIDKLIAYLQRRSYRRRTSFCPKSRAGHHRVRLLWIRYTLTDTELILRGLRTHRIALEDLRLWGRVTPPEVRPTGRIRFFSLVGLEFATLRFLGRMRGGTHFVMLLGEALRLDLISPFLGAAPSPATSSDL